VSDPDDIQCVLNDNEALRAELAELKTQYSSVTDELTDIHLNGTPTQRAELAEFKQWASDACELLHDAEFDTRTDSYERACELLRRMENP
jgi:DNA polymerase III alpha subunit (gram-positive type)